MSAAQYRENLLRYYEAFNARGFDVLEHLLADDVVSNLTDELGVGQGREAFVTYWRTAFDAIPDVRQEVLEVLAEGDWVAARDLGTGTHQGELLGIPASGNRVEKEVGVFARFKTSMAGSRSTGPMRTTSPSCSRSVRSRRTSSDDGHSRGHVAHVIGARTAHTTDHRKQSGQERTMTTEENRATLLRYADAINRRELDILGRCLAEDVVSNVTEDLGLGQGREALLAYVRMSFEGVPDARIELLEVVAEGDRVAARYRGTGTHDGELLGIPPSGNPITLEVGAFVRCNARGEIAEYRSYADNLDLMQQLGAIPEDVIG